MNVYICTRTKPMNSNIRIRIRIRILAYIVHAIAAKYKTHIKHFLHSSLYLPLLFYCCCCCSLCYISYVYLYIILYIQFFFCSFSSSIFLLCALVVVQSLYFFSFLPVPFLIVISYLCSRFASTSSLCLTLSFGCARAFQLSVCDMF